MTVTIAEHTVTRGIEWERLVVVKDKRTHRIVRPTDAWGTISTGPLSKVPLTCTITVEGGILLSLTGDETLDLPVGSLSFDVVGVFNQRSVLSDTGWISKTVPVVKGTLEVQDTGLISTLGRNEIMEIRFNKGEDYFTTLEWLDDDDAVVPAEDAYMQAKDADGNVVVDLRWFATAPNEAAIEALPNAQRGYLAPYEDKTLELHISDLNDITAGTYEYDAFFKGADGRWTLLAKGQLVVEDSVSTKP